MYVHHLYVDASANFAWQRHEPWRWMGCRCCHNFRSSVRPASAWLNFVVRRWTLRYVAEYCGGSLGNHVQYSKQSSEVVASFLFYNRCRAVTFYDFYGRCPDLRCVRMRGVRAKAVERWSGKPLHLCVHLASARARTVLANNSSWHALCGRFLVLCQVPGLCVAALWLTRSDEHSVDAPASSTDP